MFKKQQHKRETLAIRFLLKGADDWALLQHNRQKQGKTDGERKETVLVSVNLIEAERRVHKIH